MAATPKVNYQVIGSTGLKRFSGYVFEEYLRELAGVRGRAVIKEMSEGDATVGACLFVIDMLVRQVDWYWDPADDSPEAGDAAEFVEQCWDDMSSTPQETMSEILSFLPFGWSWFEVCYKQRGGMSDDPTKNSSYDDGKIGWRKWAIRSQDSLLRWEFDDEGGIQGMWQLAPPNYILTFIPIDKSLLFRTKSRKGNPEGFSILRNAYSAWYYKTNIQRIEAIGIERDLAGLPVAWVPSDWLSEDADADDKASLQNIKQVITSLRRDELEGVVFPLQYDVDGKNKIIDLTLMSGSSARQFPTDAVIQRYDHRISMSVMADFLLMGSDKVGSYALSSNKTDLFTTALDSWLNIITDVIEKYAVKPLVLMNGMDPKKCPTLRHGDIKSVDLGVLGTYIQQLTAAGASFFPDDQLDQYLRAAANLPEKSEEAAAFHAQTLATKIQQQQLSLKGQQASVDQAQQMAKNPQLALQTAQAQAQAGGKGGPPSKAGGAQSGGTKAPTPPKAP